MSNVFSMMPNISIPRSRFKQTFDHPFSYIHGDLVPQDCFMVLPGDTFSYSPADLLRMSTPITPIMGNIKCSIHAFFIPLRLIYADTEKYFGDPSNHDRVSSITPVDPEQVILPRFSKKDFQGVDGTTFIHSVSDYLGKQNLGKIFTDLQMSDADIETYLTKLNLSCLKERAYCAVWNDHFRPSLTIPPIIIRKDNTSVSFSNVGTESFTTGVAVSLKYGFKPFKVIKDYDYFTACTLSPQFGNTVYLPLGTMAPLTLVHTAVDDDTPGTSVGDSVSLSFELDTAASNASNPLDLGNPGTHKLKLWDNANEADSGAGAFAYADLSRATGASINSIRYAFQVQKYLERSNYGSKFFEILNAHYGITNPDSRLQRTERLGSHTFYVNVNQVLATADSGSAGSSTLGQTGAVSVTGSKCHLFTKAFSEPGFVMVTLNTKYERNYASGFLREDLYKTRFEIYSPEFANLGDQLTKQIELSIYDGTNQELVDPEAGFGYQEHWAELRYRKNIVSGLLRPGAGLDIWTLADDFDGDVHVPDYAFLHEDRAALSRCLVTGNSGPDFIVDSHADIVATRELPLYSIPGLIDHFGAL